MNSDWIRFGAVTTWAIVALGTGGCDKKANPTPDAIVLHTGRLMGNVYPEKATVVTPLQHYQYLAGYIHKVRAEAEPKGIPVFLIDLGDSIDGSFASYALKGRNMIEFFNALKYDAVCLGNLDGDLAPELLAQLEARVLSPFVDEKGEPAMPGTVLSTSFKRGGVTLNLAANFYGLTNPEEEPLRFPSSFGPSDARPIAIRDYNQIAGGFQRKDALTLLTWMKFESIDSKSKAFMKQLSKLGFDLILAHRIYGGDTRDAWTPDALYHGEPPVSVNILRNNSGFTVARVDLKRDRSGWQVLDHAIVPMTANSVPPDQALPQRMNQFTAELAKADAPVAKLNDRWTEADILQLYMAALTGLPDVAAVAYSPASVRAGWARGELRISQVYNSVPWRNDIVTLSIPLAEFSKVSGLEGVQMMKRDPLPDPVRLATSRFFAELIRQQPGLERTEVASVDGRLEFEFFADYLRARSPLEKVDLPQGWTDAAK